LSVLKPHTLSMGEEIEYCFIKTWDPSYERMNSIILKFTLKDWDIKEVKPISQDCTACKYLSYDSNLALQVSLNYTFLWSSSSLLYDPVPFIIDYPTPGAPIVFTPQVCKDFSEHYDSHKVCCSSKEKKIRVSQNFLFKIEMILHELQSWEMQAFGQENMNLWNYFDLSKQAIVNCWSIQTLKELTFIFGSCNKQKETTITQLELFFYKIIRVSLYFLIDFSLMQACLKFLNC
jgi:hypothetical protein